MSDNKMAQNLLSLSLSLSLILSALRRNSFKISESAPARIKVPGLFYVNVHRFKDSWFSASAKSKIHNPQSEIQRRVLKWPGKKKENRRRKRGGREEETCQNAKERIALRPDPRCTTVACRQEGAVNPVKILIVDNHPAIRHGLLEVIGGEKDIVVCGEAGDRQETLEAIHYDTLDFVILDVSLKDPSRTGFDFIPDTHSHLGPIPILVCPEKPLLLFFHRGHPCAKNNTV